MQATHTTEIVYPSSDGQPMAESTLQYEAITSLKGNLDILFEDHNEVFIAADLFWYPVEGRPDIRTAPDTMVVFGRPKGHRKSYLQWEEDNIPPQVVFEVLSHSNTPAEMEAKRAFYERYGVEEYYVYDPERGRWEGWRRRGEGFVRIGRMSGWVSPRLGIRFGRGSGERIGLRYPDGSVFLTFRELGRRWREARRRAEEERQRAERLAQQLRELGIEPEE